MKRRYKLILISVVMAMILQASSMCIMATENNKETMDIIEIANQNKELATLVKALESADLVNALKGAGPFTVFAPTNEAFNKLPNGTLEDLLKPENKGKLIDILTYHVRDGKVSSEQALKLNGQNIIMLNGKPVKVEVKDGSLYVDGAKVIVKDIMAKNGVIHIIDAVMLP